MQKPVQVLLGVALCATLMRLPARAAPSDPPAGTPADAQYLKGCELLAHHDLQKAVEAFTAAIQLNPKASAYYFQRYLTFTQLGDFPHATHDLDAAIRLAPNDPGPLFMRAEQRDLLGDTAGSLKDLALLKSIATPAFIQKLKAAAGTMYFDTADYSWVELSANFVLTVQPGDADALAQRGASRFVLGQTAAGVADLTAALAGHPSPDWAGEAHRRLGSMLYSQQHYEEAMAHAEAGLAVHPGPAVTGWLLILRGATNRQLGETGHAESDFNEAVRVNVDCVVAAAKWQYAISLADAATPEQDAEMHQYFDDQLKKSQEEDEEMRKRLQEMNDRRLEQPQQ